MSSEGKDLRWLTHERFACRMQLLLPSDTRSRPRVEDRRVLSGIIHVIRTALGLEGYAFCPWATQDALHPFPALGREGRVRCALLRWRLERASKDMPIIDAPPFQGAAHGGQLAAEKGQVHRPHPGTD